MEKSIGEIDEMLEFSKKQITRPFIRRNISASRRLFNVYLRLRHAAFEVLLSHSVWSSLFKYPPTVCAKKVSSLLREVHK